MTQASEADVPDRHAAPRLRRPSWRDPRLLIGIAVMVFSTAGVVGLVASQDRTVAVYAADRTLSSGDRLTEEHLRSVHVHLPEAAEHYLSAEAELPSDLQLTRMVGEGELVPASALAEHDPQGRQTITVHIEHELARAVTTGRSVDVWGASEPHAGGGEQVAAEPLAEGAEVLEVREAASAFGAQSGFVVEVLLAPEEISSLMTAQSAGVPLSVVPAAEDPGNE